MSKDRSWKTLSSEYLFRRPWLTARRDTVELPDGRVNPEYYVIEYPSWVNVIAITTDGKIIMERQWRHGLGVMSTEIPAGVVEVGEEPLAAAKRELLEETGYAGGDWQFLMKASANPGSLNNLNYSFIARGVEPTGSRKFDEYEDLEVMLMDRSDVIGLLERGEMCQSMMIAPLYKALHEGLL